MYYIDCYIGYFIWRDAEIGDVGDLSKDLHAGLYELGHWGTENRVTWAEGRFPSSKMCMERKGANIFLKGNMEELCTDTQKLNNMHWRRHQGNGKFEEGTVNTGSNTAKRSHKLNLFFSM